MKVGDIYEKDGKRYQILAVLGINCYSQKELEDEPMPVLEEEIKEEIIKKKTRRKKV